MANEVIKIPISVSKVKSTIGSASNDVGGLCTSSTINMWAKYKPVNWNKISHTMPSNSSEEGYTDDGWWRGTKGNCGLDIPEFPADHATADSEAIRELVSAWDDNGNGWKSEKVSGGAASPFRIADFDCYYHGAKNPFNDNSISHTKASNDMTITVYLHAVIGSSNIYELGLKDFSFKSPMTVGTNQGKTLSQCYLGIIVKSGDTYAYVTSDTPIGTAQGTSNTSVSFTVQELTSTLISGAISVYPIISRLAKPVLNEAATGDTFGNNTIYPCYGTHFTVEITPDAKTYIAYSPVVSGKNVVIESGAKYIKFAVRYNAGISTYTFRNVHASIVNRLGATIWAGKDIDSAIEIDGVKQYTIQGTEINADYSADRDWENFKQACQQNGYKLRITATDMPTIEDTINIL